MSLVMEGESSVLYVLFPEWNPGTLPFLTVKLTVFRPLYQRWTCELIGRMCQVFHGRELDFCSCALAD